MLLGCSYYFRVSGNFHHWSSSSSSLRFSLGFFNIDVSAELFSFVQSQSSIEGRFFAKLDKGQTLWLAVRSHQEFTVEDISTLSEKTSNIIFVSLEGKALDTNFEFSFFIFNLFNFLRFGQRLLNGRLGFNER